MSGIVDAVLKRVESTIVRNGLFREGDRIVVAVSGGPDSMAALGILIDLAPKWGFELAVAHLHHGIRGSDAEEEMELVERTAGRFGLPFFSKKLPKGYLKGFKGSLHENARRERYGFLKDVTDRWGGRRVALGHQADDQSETVLAALVRGAGTRGLRGMPYLKEGLYARPLLDVTRSEIIEYLKAASIPYAKDPSNEDRVYLRSRIRHDLLPFLRDGFNLRMDEALRRTAEVCREEDDFLDQAVQSSWKALACVDDDAVEIPLDRYYLLHPAIRRRLVRRAFRRLCGDEKGLDLLQSVEADRLAVAAAEECGGKEKRLPFPRGVRAVVGGGVLLVSREDALSGKDWAEPVRIPGETVLPDAGIGIKWDILDGCFIDELPKEKDCIYLNPEALSGDAILRNPRPGDRIRPMGLGGTRKVQDVLTDAKIPRRMRWKVPVMVDDAGIVWVVGLRLDERMKVPQAVKKVLRARVFRP